MSDFQEERNIRVTRKNHSCDLCLRRIPKGFSAHYFKGSHDGEFYSGYVCNTCYALVTKYPQSITDCEGLCDPQILQDTMSDYNVNRPLQLYNCLKETQMYYVYLNSKKEFVILPNEDRLTVLRFSGTKAECKNWIELHSANNL